MATILICVTAAADAKNFANALRIAATRLFGKDKIHLTLLSGSQSESSSQASRDNLIKALKAARRARHDDILVIYLAGHGVKHRDEDEYYYLASDAHTAELSDPEVRRHTTVSSRELTEWIKQISALKQVLILDTCASGGLVKTLTEGATYLPAKSAALERVMDRTGMHVLAGCTADAVSYETSRYAQGLLTYSLLFGMRGAALHEGSYVDVLRLFNFVEKKVPEMAAVLGGIQKPIYASPRAGGSFYIGEITVEDQPKIPVQAVRPLFVQSNFFGFRRARRPSRFGGKSKPCIARSFLWCRSKGCVR